ncbi:MAG TPA: ABC transporter substrate-binding protein [Thermotogota bacterium]|nr:ABC transporter substrate-binding protein [Thermotogota bacterium]NLZ14887.1 ABC transporter substrate-binding protein [Thermotogaceae bacterium]HNR62507.1 ABC transporter substrate-binding protein [Thermotogota bacterium]HNT94513.1 ABC transporter substrate-binding protein [Thermotogota bacterium]HOZ11148.1 ABC transporter substrate-binding protein [Thermotogota bacterium]
MKKALSVLFVLSLLLGTVFAGIVPSDNLQYIVEPVKGKTGGTLYFYAVSDPKTFNPAFAQETSSTDITGIMWDSLVDFGKNVEIRGGNLATGWEVTPEGNGWIFTIRKGLQWSDGKPLTTEDVYWTFKNIWFVPENCLSTYDVITDAQGRAPQIEMLDENRIKIWYKEPYAVGLRQIGGVQIFPKHIVEPVLAAGKWQEFWTLADVNKLVGSGAMIVTEYLPDQRVVLSRNPYYFRVDLDGNRLPYFDSMVFVSVPNLNTAQLKFEAGELDYLAPQAAQYPNIKAQAEEKGWDVGVVGPTYSTLFLAFNQHSPTADQQYWFRNKKFRNALSYAIDRDSMIEVIYNGLAQPQWGPVSPASPFYDPAIEDLATPYDLEKAKEMLKAAGFTWNAEGKLVDDRGIQVKFLLTTNAGNNQRETACNLIVDTFGQIGIDVTFNPIDFNTLVGALTATGNWETMVMGLTGGPDPHSGSNVNRIDGDLHFWNIHPDTGSWADPDNYWISNEEWKIDRIFRDQVREMNEETRWQMFADFQRLYVEEAPLLYTVQGLRLYAKKAELKGTDLGSSSTPPILWNLWALYRD